MSCGFEKPVPRVEREIDYAYTQKVLVVAAAGNAGATGGPRWPASDNNVLCINAAYGHGNKYGNNPTPGRNKTRFSLLGCAVEGYRRKVESTKPIKVSRCGTSHATAVATAVAAISMQILRDCRKHFDSADDEDAHQKAEKVLRTKPGMEKIFYHMTDMDRERDGYDFVRPWSVVPAAGGGPRAKALQLAQNIVSWCQTPA
jgi:hypothetical protein